MKIRDGYILDEFAGANVAIYVGNDTANELNGVIKLNDAGVLMWKKLAEGCTKEELLKAVTDEYDVDASVAMADIEAFLDSLRTENIIEDE